MDAQANEEWQQWDIALEQLQFAIEILDRSNAPAHIAAHVDLAIHQLRDVLGKRSSSAQLDQVVTKADPQ